jgi:hypothetical protein
MQMETTCPHVVASDGDWMGRMRFHQSWYRRNRLKLDPGPYGNHLLPKHGDEGRNFINDDIFAFAKSRLAQGQGAVEKNRLLRNMLSRQPLCFNLFAPLALNLPDATDFLRALLPNRSQDARALRVSVEYAPPSETHLNDRTAFDAFIEYELPDLQKGFVGIEAKLTEPFSAKSYPFERYAKWGQKADSWWSDHEGRAFGDKQYNQLWRDHLLAFSMLRQPQPQYAEGYLAVLYHDLDANCPDAIRSYRGQLTPQGEATLLEWPLGKVVHTLANATNADRAWLAALKERYIDVALSDADYAAYQRPGKRRRKKNE